MYHKSRRLLLQGNAFWGEKCQGHLLKTCEQNIPKAAGKSIEVYVDDMLMKSKITDLTDMFTTLEGYGMKLNFDKCAFEVA